jgi:predicted AlkP superfamily pyrophosphatase or phosphodiesterase
LKRFGLSGLIALAAAGAALAVASCTLFSKTVTTGGVVALKNVAAPNVPGKHVIVFALDGVSYDQFMTVVRSGKAPNIGGILGKERGGGVFEHGYSTPDAVAMLPSSTAADWSAIFTGVPPAFNGVPGDEWFVREQTRFFAPVPISVDDTGDVQNAVANGLFGKALAVPTLYEQLGVDTNVSLLWIYRGASLYTIVGPSSGRGSLWESRRRYRAAVE